MPFYSYRKHSKTDFGTSNEFPTLEQMNTGSLQRIADAIEKIAVNYTKMEKEIKDNGSGLNEVCLAQPFKFTTTLQRHISFKPLLCVCKIFNNYFLRGLLTFKLNN